MDNFDCYLSTSLVIRVIEGIGWQIWWLCTWEHVPYLPKMDFASISPLTGALPWATTVKGEGLVVCIAVVCAVVVVFVAAIGTATTVGYVGVATFVAAPIISYEILLVW